MGQHRTRSIDVRTGRRADGAVFVSWVPFLLCTFSGQTAGLGQTPDYYAPAALEENSGGGSQISVFPVDAPVFVIPINEILSEVAFVNEGRALYATGWRPPQPAFGPRNGPATRNPLLRIPGLLRVELAGNTGATMEYPLTRFSDIRHFAVSQSEGTALISGSLQGRRACGLYEVALRRDGPKTLIEVPDCLGNPWGRISLNPDGTRAVVETVAQVDRLGRVLRKSDGLVELDVRAPAITPFEVEGRYPQWSPDGSSIAYVAEVGNRSLISLFDPQHPSQRRTLTTIGGGARPISWSPDSRHLLLAAPEAACGQVTAKFSLLRIDAANGETSVIAGSECMVSGFVAVWVNMSAPLH
jgi:hypothetical protein